MNKIYCSLGQSRDADILFINESNAKSNIESWDFFKQMKTNSQLTEQNHETRWTVKSSSPWICNFSVSVDSLAQPKVSNSKAKINGTPWQNTSMALINLLEALWDPLNPFSSAGWYLLGLEVMEEKESQDTVTAGCPNPRWASATNHGESPDCMSNLSAILAAACSV